VPTGDRGGRGLNHAVRAVPGPGALRSRRRPRRVRGVRSRLGTAQ